MKLKEPHIAIEAGECFSESDHPDACGDTPEKLLFERARMRNRWLLGTPKSVPVPLDIVRVPHAAFFFWSILEYCLMVYGPVKLMNCLDLQSALGWEYQAELSKHESQTDAAKGFGGRYGVQADRQDEVIDC